MSHPILTDKQQKAIATSLEAVIRIGVLLIIAYFCLQIVAPFIIPVLWGAVIAIALYPLFLRIRGVVGGKDGIAATIIAVVPIALILWPAIAVSGSLFDFIGQLADALESGDIHVPPPPPGVADWPLIGSQAYALWGQASTNLTAFVEAFKPQVLAGLSAFASLLGSGGAAVLFTIIAMAIAGAFLATADVCVKGIKAFARRMAGDQGEKFVDTSALVVKSVATGVIGVAVIQAVLGWIGLALAGVPLAIVWTLLLLVLAIAQIPALLIMGPAIAYVFATADGLTATIFAVYAIFVSISDGFLKPLLLGRGVSIPTLVILLGAIGGMVALGIIGLFLGAVVLALGWELLTSWVQGKVDEPEMENADA